MSDLLWFLLGVAVVAVPYVIYRIKHPVEPIDWSMK
jgi:hypothetical protein